MKPFWEMTDADMKACLNATDWCRANYEYFRGGGFSSHFRCRAEMPVTMLRVNVIDGIGPVLQLAEGYTADLPDQIHNTIDKRTDPTWPTTWFCPRLTGEGAFKDVYSVMANWGRQPRRYRVRPCRRRFDHPGLHAAYPREYAQCAGSADLPPPRLGCLWHRRPPVRRLPCLRHLRSLV